MAVVLAAWAENPENPELKRRERQPVWGWRPGTVRSAVDDVRDPADWPAGAVDGASPWAGVGPEFIH